MRLSESLRRGIMETFAGGIINKFKIKRRRVTLFFEDILANYIKECEEKGYSEEMREIGEAWNILAINTLVPYTVKKSPISIFSKFMKIVWINVGILRDIEFDKKDGYITVKVRENTITRIIGKNSFAMGCFMGILEAKFDSKIECINAVQDKEHEEYLFKIGNKTASGGRCKKREKYNRLNELQEISGFTLEDAIRKKVFQMKGNRIFFRGKSICNSENTLFHILGNKNILLESVPKISYKYFKEIILNETASNKKLTLLKNILQITGWGIVTVVQSDNKIIIQIKNPPYGLQIEKDNWTFLINVLLGYLWLINRDFRISGIEEQQKYLKAIYTKPAY